MRSPGGIAYSVRSALGLVWYRVKLLGLGLLVRLTTVRASSLLVTLVLVVYTADWLSDSLGIIPRQVTWMSDLIVVLLFGRSVSLVLAGKRAARRFPFLPFLLWIVFLSVCSVAYNKENLGLLIPGIRSYTKYAVLCFSLFVHDIGPRAYRVVFRMLVALALLQVPVTLYQFLSVGRVGDWAGGTLGRNATGQLSVFGGLIICVLLENYFHTRRMRYLLTALLPLASAFFGSTKFSFILYPLIYVSYFLLNFEKFRSKATAVVVVGLILSAVAATVSIFDTFDKGYVASFYRDPAQAYAYEMRVSGGASGNIGRVGTLRYASELIQNDVGHMILGRGAGSTAESFLGRAFESRLYRQGAFEASFTAAARLIAEMGLAGCAVYVSLFLVWIRRQSAEYLNGNLLFMVAAVIVLSSFYVDTISHDSLSLPFWFVLAALHKRNNRGEDVAYLG